LTRLQKPLDVIIVPSVADCEVFIQNWIEKFFPLRSDQENVVTILSLAQLNAAALPTFPAAKLIVVPFATQLCQKPVLSSTAVHVHQDDSISQNQINHHQIIQAFRIFQVQVIGTDLSNFIE
jgi:hypothetical protein